MTNPSPSQLVPLVNARIEKVTQEETQALETEPNVRQQALADAWHEALRAQRSAITGLYRDNEISEAVFDEMTSEIDSMLEDEESGWPEIQTVLNPETPDKPGKAAL